MYEFIGIQKESKKLSISIPGATKTKKRKAEFDLSGSEPEEASELSHQSDSEEEDIPFDPNSEEAHFAASLDAIAGYGSSLLRRLGDLEKAKKDKSTSSKEAKQ